MREQPLLHVQERQEWLDALDSVVREGGVAAGEALINAGLQLPIMQPETLLVFHLQQN